MKTGIIVLHTIVHELISTGLEVGDARVDLEQVAVLLVQLLAQLLRGLDGREDVVQIVPRVEQVVPARINLLDDCTPGEGVGGKKGYVRVCV